MILGWYANLPRKSIPPEWMWHLDYELERWFDDLDLASGKTPSADDDDGEAPMMRNALAVGARR
jgi:hypothetical protein